MGLIPFLSPISIVYQIMLRLVAARASTRLVRYSAVRLAADPSNFNNMPGSFLNGENGREMETKPDIGPPAAEQQYGSHEFYNHDKMSFYDALADCNHMRVVPPDAGFIDVKHRKE